MSDFGDYLPKRTGEIQLEDKDSEEVKRLNRLIEVLGGRRKFVLEFSQSLLLKVSDGLPTETYMLLFNTTADMVGNLLKEDRQYLAERVAECWPKDSKEGAWIRLE